ncbi:MAG: TIGR00295 family protein [Thermoplasmata archaeon]|nr:MAG: TIGR00295 family protein [Thermoplasmata archaeon]
MTNEALPTRDECLKTLRTSGCSENVITHCLAVEGLAVKIAKLAHADLELVSAGALLHDIGRAKTHGVGHAVEGGRIARELGFDERLVLIIERHIGAGITKNEAERIGLPAGEYIPQTLEEKIVAHSDNLIDEDRKVPVSKVISRFEKEGYGEAAQKIRDLHSELSGVCGVDLDLI